MSEDRVGLIQAALRGEPFAWEKLVDELLPTVMGIVDRIATSRGAHLDAAQRDELVAAVFQALADDAMAALRHYDGRSTLETFVTVVARRVVDHELAKRPTPAA
jgi:RNA polymerase sigma-70 factor (ECF subfamily)